MCIFVSLFTVYVHGMYHYHYNLQLGYCPVLIMLGSSFNILSIYLSNITPVGTAPYENLTHLNLSNCLANVTVGNSPTAPGTLGSYQTHDWARLATHAGVVTTERNHIYHLLHNIYSEITSLWYMVWSWYITSLVQYTRWVTSWLHRTESHVNYRCQPHQLHQQHLTSGHEKK